MTVPYRSGTEFLYIWNGQFGGAGNGAVPGTAIGAVPRAFSSTVIVPANEISDPAAMVQPAKLVWRLTVNAPEPDDLEPDRWMVSQMVVTDAPPARWPEGNSSNPDRYGIAATGVNETISPSSAEPAEDALIIELDEALALSNAFGRILDSL